MCGKNIFLLILISFFVASIWQDDAYDPNADPNKKAKQTVLTKFEKGILIEWFLLYGLPKNLIIERNVEIEALFFFLIANY